jgi:L-alanine-DL-glutamate epimerase-like enolase superfamily enzyme
VGLTTSRHLKAAVGGPGDVAVDANPNRLRDLFAGDAIQVREGQVALPGAPGLHVEPDLAACRHYLTYRAR